MSEDIKGKAIGGKARAAKLTPEKRREIALKAVAAREALKDVPRATHGSPDHPLKIGDAEIPCYVLSDGTRVLSQRGLISGLGMGSGSDRLVNFLNGKAISQFVGPEAVQTIQNPIRFLAPHGGVPVYGYPATILVDLCEAVLSARSAGALQSQQMHIADQCEVLVRGFARVGIIALVDEATGYQKDRARDALALILERFVAKELQPYVRTFPAEYYEELFRLRGLPFPPENPSFRPKYFGLLTNDIVYGRLAPGLLEQLKKIAKSEERKAHLHRRLTSDIGHPKLREHLASVTTIMKLSDSYKDFIAKLNKIHPRFGETIPLDLEEPDRG
ncbi:P63C domain-containing protein [Burkholderia ubonensis]|uniref:P63C domain-containing protein n=1 Tax=Burkholderia ubonensis TaxID=101571 RepID=UPI0009B44D77|nr:P63C domain-containing protein [Burkholderia ubonensis]